MNDLFFFYKKKNYDPFFMDVVQSQGCRATTKSLHFTRSKKPAGVPGIHLISFRRMKDCVNLGATQFFFNPDRLSWESSTLTTRRLLLPKLIDRFKKLNLNLINFHGVSIFMEQECAKINIVQYRHFFTYLGV